MGDGREPPHPSSTRDSTTRKMRLHPDSLRPRGMLRTHGYPAPCPPPQTVPELRANLLPSMGQSPESATPSQSPFLLRPGLLGRCQGWPPPLMALLPGQKVGGEGTAPSVLSWGERGGQQWPGLPDRAGVAQGSAVTRVRGPIPGGVQSNLTPGQRCAGVKGHLPPRGPRAHSEGP